VQDDAWPRIRTLSMHPQGTPCVASTARLSLFPRDARPNELAELACAPFPTRQQPSCTILPAPLRSSLISTTPLLSSLLSNASSRPGPCSSLQSPSPFQIRRRAERRPPAHTSHVSAKKIGPPAPADFWLVPFFHAAMERMARRQSLHARKCESVRLQPKSLGGQALFQFQIR